MIALGYVCSFFAVIFLYFIAKLIKNKDISRKVLHIGIIGVLFIANAFWESKLHFSIISGISLILVIIFGKMHFFDFVDKENKDLNGLILFCFSILCISLTCTIYEELDVFFVFPIFALCLGDGFASLIGNLIKSPKTYKNKTLVGSLSCLIFSLFGFLICKYFFIPEFEIKYLILLSFLVCIAELFPFGFDNLTVSFSAFIFSILLYNFGETIFVALVISVCVFFIAIFSKLIDYVGSILVALIAFLFFQYGGLVSVLYLVGCYAILIVIEIIHKIMKNDLSNIVLKTKTKDGVEILVNGLFPVILMILYAIFNDSHFLIMCLCCISANFVDSLSSDIGTLSNKKPYDIFHKKYVTAGLSGGMSFLGTFASLIGSIIFSISIVLITQSKFILIIPMTIIMMLGTFVDTTMGSLLQVKYRCPICEMITENVIHCGTNTEYYSGVKFFNNDIVNLVSSFIVFGFTFILFAIV